MNALVLLALLLVLLPVAILSGDSFEVAAHGYEDVHVPNYDYEVRNRDSQPYYAHRGRNDNHGEDQMGAGVFSLMAYLAGIVGLAIRDKSAAAGVVDLHHDDPCVWVGTGFVCS